MFTNESATTILSGATSVPFNSINTIMPPKKKGKGKKKGKDDASEEPQKPKTPEPSEKEVLLKQE